jgi:hypothetical protein
MVDCALPHNATVVSVTTPATPPAVDQERVTCAAAVAAADHGVSPPPAPRAARVRMPSAALWAAGDHAVVCAAVADHGYAGRDYR